MPVLRELLLMPGLSPLHNNISAAMVMVLYYRIVIEFVSKFRERFKALTFQSRQILQMSLTTSIVFWPLFDTSEWSWRLNALLPAAMSVRMILKVSLNQNQYTHTARTRRGVS